MATWGSPDDVARNLLGRAAPVNGQGVGAAGGRRPDERQMNGPLRPGSGAGAQGVAVVGGIHISPPLPPALTGPSGAGFFVGEVRPTRLRMVASCVTFKSRID